MEHQLSLEIEPTGELMALWKESLQQVEAQIGREAVESWLSDVQPVAMGDGKILLGVPNATARTWIEKKYARVLGGALSAVSGQELRIEAVVQKRAPAAKSEKPQRVQENGAARAPASSMFAPIPLNEKYTFENFVVGQSNRFAHAAASAVAAKPGREYNPLFIYGGVGLGKTHLMQAIGHELRRQNPRARVAYVSGETFTTHFVTSLREHREEEFRRAYRGVDIWLVDDIQFIADKTGTKEEFFHTFNELYLTNRQIVLAADRPPRELRLMEDRLRTRLESGLMVEVAAPELETRIAILQKRAELEGADIPPDVVYHIARAVTDNVRVLEAALIRMLALASLSRCSIDAELASRALGAFVQEGGMASISMLAIIRVVCDHFQITELELTGHRRDRQTALARQVAMYLIRDIARKPLNEIGQMFGGKTHSTVLYSCAKLEKEMKTDECLASAIRGLRTRLSGSGG